MPLTPEDKRILAESIVGNCKCKTEDIEVLNTLSDESLLSLANNAMPKEMMAEEEEAESPEESNPAEEEAEKITPVKNGKKPMAGGTATCNHQTNNESMGTMFNTEKMLTENEFLALAPASIREDLAHARAAKQAKKVNVINQLTAHVPDERKQLVANELNTKSLAELEALLELVPPVVPQQASAPVVNYRGLPGSYGAPLRNSLARPKPNDILKAPTIDWSKAD